MAVLTIKVGSKNPAKVEAVREILQDYPHLKDAAVEGIEVESGVSDQPKSLDEVTAGAMVRAKNAFVNCNYSIGLESGFMSVPNSASGYMNVCAAAVYDGKVAHLGLSSGFETPDKEIMRLAVEEGVTFAQAANKTGFTSDTHIGKHNGIIGVLTKDKLTRKEFTKQALRTALIHIDRH